MKPILITKVCAAAFAAAFFVASMPMGVQAAAPHQTHGWGRGEGRSQSVNTNDHHTSSWDRFGPFNYQFSSGPDFSHTFGGHTFTPTYTPDRSFANIRRDRHAADRPLPYGIFSSITSTPMVNPSFQQSVFTTNQQQPFVMPNPSAISRFDTTFQGANALNRPPGSLHPNSGGLWTSPTSPAPGGLGAAPQGTAPMGTGVSAPHISGPGQTSGGFLAPTSILN